MDTNILMYLSIVVIFITAIVKTTMLIIKKKNQQTTVHPNRNARSSTPIRIEDNSIIETGPMVYYANDTHNQSSKEYRFNYKKVNDSWRAYILKMPSLGRRDASGYATHRLWDDGNPYICWDTSVKSLNDMQIISRVWADNIQEYIATGKKFG